jgi:hypothetical protein
VDAILVKNLFHLGEERPVDDGLNAALTSDPKVRWIVSQLASKFLRGAIPNEIAHVSLVSKKIAHMVFIPQDAALGRNPAPVEFPDDLRLRLPANELIEYPLYNDSFIGRSGADLNVMASQIFAVSGF